MGVGVYGERRGHTLQSVIRLGQPTPIVLSRRKPSGSRYESRSVPPARLMIWIRSRLSDEVSAPFVDVFAPAGDGGAPSAVPEVPLSLSTAFTAISANISLSCESTFDESVVLAMLSRSWRKAFSSLVLSIFAFAKEASAASRARR